MDFERLLILAAAEVFAPTTAAFALAAIGLNIHFGFTGLLNMGHAGFMLLGAYGFAISTIAGAPLVLALLIAVACAVLFALVLGIPTLKLRGDYLAIVTISAAEIVRMVGRSTLFTDITGASSGLRGNTFKETFIALSPLADGTTTIGPFTYGNNLSNGWWVRIAAWTLVLLALLLVYLLVRSPWGRVLKGIREDEDAMRSLGKNVYAYKMQALVLGGVLGALGGIVYVLPGSVQPDTMGRSMTFFIWTVLLLGGAATIFGPVLGAILYFVTLMVLRTGMRELIPSDVLSPTQVEPFAGMLVGFALMCLVIFRPQGILGDKKELAFDVR
jgi:neutral amino acid transport system permease protein